MKIAIINQWAISNKAIGGTERFVMDLAESLTKLGNVVDVYMFSGKNHKENNINYININLFNMEEEADEYVFQERLGDFSCIEQYKKLAVELEKRIDGKKYDAIHINSQLLLEAWKDCRRVFTIHTNPFEYELAFGKKAFEQMINIMKEQAENKLTTFVVPSEYYAKEYKKLTLTNNIYYIPHAIDVKRLECSADKDEIEKKYNLSKETINILLPSRLEPIQKQPKLFLDTCCKLDENIKNRIQIIYTGLDKQYIKYVEEMQRISKSNRLNTKILRFDEIGEAYKIANICVLPSKSESFGYSALECLVLGIPTILNNIPTFYEISRNNERAILFNGSKEDLKIKFEEILKEDIIFNRKINLDWNKNYNLLEFGKRYMNIFTKE